MSLPPFPLPPLPHLVIASASSSSPLPSPSSSSTSAHRPIHHGVPNLLHFSSSFLLSKEQDRFNILFLHLKHVKCSFSQTSYEKSAQKLVLFLSIEEPLVSATFVFFLSCSFVVLNFFNSPRINEYSTLEKLLSSRALDIISFTEFSYNSIKILMFSCFSKLKLSFLPISLAIRHRPSSPPAVPISGKANATVSRVPNIVSVEVVKSRNACSECTSLRALRNCLDRTSLI